MPLNPTPSDLDQQQIIQRVMDADSDRLRVDAIVTATIGDIIISASESTIAIADQLNGNLLKVEGDGSINVNTVLAYTSDSVTAYQGTSPWIVSGTVTANAGTGTFLVDGSTHTQPISAITLPLPTGASTETTLSLFKTANHSDLLQINTTLGSPFQAGGSIGNTVFAATQSGVWSTGRTWVLSSGTDSINVNNFPATVAVTQSSSPWIIDGSGTVQPISATSLPLPTGAATQTTLASILTAVGSPIQNSGGSVTTLQGTSPWVVSGTVTTSPNINVHDGSGTAISATGSSLNVDVTNTISASQSGTWNITNVSGTVSLPTGASTETTLSAFKTANHTDLGTINTTLGSPFQAGASIGNTVFGATQSGTWNITNVSGTISLPIGAATSNLQTTGNTSLSSIDSKTPSLGQALAVGSVPVVLTAAQLSTLTPLSTVASTQSGTWTVQPGNTANTTAWKVDGSAVTQPISVSSLPLPTGAATSSLQTTGNTALATINTTLGSPFQAGGSIGNTAFASTQSGTWTVQPGNTANTTAWKVDGSAVTQPVSGTITATQSGTWNIGTLTTVTNPVAVTQSTSPWVISGTVTSNIGTTGGLALDTSVNGILLAQGSTTSGQTGSLIQGAVTTGAPTYITAKTNPLSLTTTGSLRVDGSGTTQPISGSISISNFPATTAVTQSTSPWVVSGTVAATQSGTWSTRTLDGSGNTISSTSSALDVNLKTSSITLPVSGTVAATQSGTWTVQPGNTANTTAWKVDGSAVTQPVSGTVTAAQATAASLNATVVGTGTFAAQVTGTVTANAGTNLNTSLLALEAGGNLATVVTNTNNLSLAQASTTLGQKGALILGATTTAAPTYITAQSNPLSLTTAGALRTDASGTTQPISGTIAATQSGAWAVSVNNASGASAVNIQDGGNSITVDNGGTFAVQATLSAETTKVIGTVNVAAGQTIAVTNTGTFATQATLAAETTKVIGTVNISSGQSVALASGSAVIGHVIADSGSTTAVTGNVASTVADGANVTLGAKADAKSTATDTTPITVMSVLKQISASVQVPPSSAVTNIGTFAVQATLAAETTKVIGTINVAASQTIAVTNTGTFATQSTLAAETTKVIGTINVAAAQTIAVTNAGTFATQATGPTLTKGTQAATGYSVQNLKDAGRTALRFYATAAAAGTTTTETAITLTKSSGTAATGTGTSFTPTSGKTFRIQYISFATRGNATATIQSTTFNLRINTAGAVTTSSTPIVLAMRSATAAVASDWDRVIVEIPDGYEIAGDGTLQWGVTAAATYTTNAPTWDVTIVGYEY